MLEIYKDVPQGSILEPILLFKIFVNDIFIFVNKCDLYNYDDDNTLSKSDNTLETVIESLEEDSRSLMSWFAFKMQANPDKFQAIAIGNKTHKQNIVFDLNGSKINCNDEVKLLGITINFKLDFNKHISKICKKAARQL